MPTNPFGQDDPLAGGAGKGSTWGGAAGAGAGGFGDLSADPADEQYDVVEISEDQPAPAATGIGKKDNSKGVKGTPSLAAREAALAKREQEVRRREAALASRGAAGIDPMMIKNFPPCLPIVHHDITNDIPEYNKAITRAGFMLLMATITTLVFNLVAVVIAVIVASVSGGAAALFFAILYCVIGVPGAWYTWYNALYKAMMSDGALSFAGFFFTFFIHTGFCIWSAISPALADNDFAHTGWLPAIELFKGSGGNKFAGIFYIVGAAMWTACSFFSVTYMARVYAKMRGGDLVNRATQEAYALGAQHAATEMQRNAQANRR